MLLNCEVGFMDNKIIGNRINTALALREKKQKELAEVLNVKDNVVSYWCSGTRIPNTEQIIKIGKYLNVSTDYLLGLSDVISTNPAIRDISQITGLNENTINFLAFNKSIENETTFNRPFIDFIEFFIAKVNRKCSFSFDIAQLREDTTLYAKFLEQLIKQSKKPHFIDTIDEGSIKREIDDIIASHSMDDGAVEELKNSINGCKYTLSQYFAEVIDEFSISNIENYSTKDIQKLENEYYKGNI